jgi:hypothetical protein
MRTYKIGDRVIGYNGVKGEVVDVITVNKPVIQIRNGETLLLDIRWNGEKNFLTYEYPSKISLDPIYYRKDKLKRILDVKI